MLCNIKSELVAQKEKTLIPHFMGNVFMQCLLRSICRINKDRGYG